MKKLLIVLLMTGCCTLNESYIKQDRKDFNTMTPRVLKMIDDTGLYDDNQKQDMRDRLQGRDTRITAGEETFK